MSKKRGRPTKNGSAMKVRMGFRISGQMLEHVEAVCSGKGICKTEFIIEAIRAQLYKIETERNMEIAFQQGKSKYPIMTYREV